MGRLPMLLVLCLTIAGFRAFSVAEASGERLRESAPAPQEDSALTMESLAATGEAWGASRTGEASEPRDAAIAVTLAHLRSRHTGLSGPELPALAELIVSESRRYEIDPALTLAVIRVESGCFNYAVSQVGALGLMQVMPATGEELASRLGLEWRGSESLFDPRLNVRVGIAYLKQLSDRYGSTHTALAAYNWGPGRIDRRLRTGQGVPRLYASRVLRTLRAAEASSQTS